MSWNYGCPKCKAMLNPHNTIILTARHGEKSVLIGIHPDPGNYEFFLPPDVFVQPGSKWDFLCPVCHAELSTEDNENLCVIEMWKDEQVHKIFFSSIAGEQATFVVKENVLEQKHGKDSDVYLHSLIQLKYIRN